MMTIIEVVLCKVDASNLPEKWTDEAVPPSAVLEFVDDELDALVVVTAWRGDGGEYVFNLLGKPVDRTSTKAWAAAKKWAGIEDFRWHDLRHTWASWHIQSGTGLQELQELGGWSTVDMVLRYAHLTADRLL